MFVSYKSEAQKLTFCDKTMADESLFISNYIIAKSDNNIIIWFYDRQKKTIQLNICNEKMHLLNQASFKVKKMDHLFSLHFFQKDSGCSIIAQYDFNRMTITQLFSYDKTANIIFPLQIMEQADVLSGLTVKYSANGKYTGLIKSYQFNNDST